MALGLGSFLFQGVSAVTSYVAGRQEAAANAASAKDAWRNDQEQITRREMEESDALKQKLTQQNIEEAQALAEAEVSSAAAGVEGITLDNILRDVSRRAATNRETARTNTDYTVAQLQAERKGSSSRAASRINAVPEPSPLSLVAGLGEAAMGGYTSYSQARMRTM